MNISRIVPATIFLYLLVGNQAKAQAHNGWDRFNPSVLTVNSLRNEVEPSVKKRLLRLHALSEGESPKTIVGSAEDFLNKVMLESKKQDMEGVGLKFELKGIEPTFEIVFDWPPVHKLNDFLLSTAERNKINFICSGGIVYLCDEEGASKIIALEDAIQLRGKIVAGGQWMRVPEELKILLKNALTSASQAHEWDQNGEFEYQQKGMKCIFAVENSKEVWITDEVKHKPYKVIRHYLLPIKQAMLAATGSFDSVETFIQYTDQSDDLLGFPEDEK